MSGADCGELAIAVNAHGSGLQRAVTFRRWRLATQWDDKSRQKNLRSILRTQASRSAHGSSAPARRCATQGIVTTSCLNSQGAIMNFTVCALPPACT